MSESKTAFNLQNTLNELKHYLPSQAPLKDFIHHNTLHAFQHDDFHEALQKASVIFGYRTYLNIEEYRQLYFNHKINKKVLANILLKEKGSEADKWHHYLIYEKTDEAIYPRIGQLRSLWKSEYKINLDKEVHSLLFKIVGAYLDQGISIWNMPTSKLGFWESVKELEKNSLTSFFRTKRAKKMLFDDGTNILSLLKIIVDDESLYEQYLFDQQFCHPGWSGMVAVLENNNSTLLEGRNISFEDFIKLELLLEIDSLESKFNGTIPKISDASGTPTKKLFSPIQNSILFEIYRLWQEAYEWSFYDQVLKGIKQADSLKSSHNGRSFQALLCIDDRECSFRRYLEHLDPECKTFGTPGFFNIDSYFQSENSKFITKICPAPISPKHLIKEENSNKKIASDAHFTKNSHSILGGWMISLTLGFWSIVQLFKNIFRPGKNAMLVSSFGHMDKSGRLQIENKHPNKKQNGLQLGYTIEEMTDRIEGLLKSIGLVDHFAPIIYTIGHGASSVNNTHYAGYDCGACSGRPGSVNARTIAHIGNHPEVRENLKLRGIDIPTNTQFVGALHETTRDEIEYYDIDVLNDENQKKHTKITSIIDKALSLNAKERSRRFILIDSKKEAKKVHQKVKLRSVSLFEPRPELNHATNALCIIGRRELTDHLFLDRRAFMNSYDYNVDPKGIYLRGILNAATPVCGGINLEYYFSRVDSYKLGAGSKLPHNVMGLLGVANGMDGDLRTGLPTQMVEVHDPVRLLMIVEHYPEIVLEAIKSNESTYEWFKNSWEHLIVIHPETHNFYLFKNEKFETYHTLTEQVDSISDFSALIESREENFPVFILNN
jgi:uncharacterized protein